MVVLSGEQITMLIRLLRAVLQGENYRITEVEEAIDFLTHANTIQCPFEKAFAPQLGAALAKEIMAALTGKMNCESSDR